MVLLKYIHFRMPGCVNIIQMCESDSVGINHNFLLVKSRLSTVTVYNNIHYMHEKWWSLQLNLQLFGTVQVVQYL